LRDGWLGNDTRTVKPVVVHPGVFKIPVNWIHQRRIVLGMGPEEQLEDEEPWVRTADAYILGDRLADADLKDAVTDGMVMLHLMKDDEESDNHIDRPVRNRVSRETQPGSKLRLLRFHAAFECQIEGIFSAEDGPAFLVEFTGYRVTRTRRSLTSAADCCSFRDGQIHGFTPR
jgi:hypothetical protein